MANDDIIFANQINSFRRFSKDVERFCQDEDGTVYITTKYGVFALKENRIFELVSEHNKLAKYYKSRKPLFVENNGKTESNGQVASINLLAGAKRMLEISEKHEFIEAGEPVNLGPNPINSTFRVISKNDTIIHCYKGPIINYIKVILGSKIDYSISDYTDKKGFQGGILKAESGHGKAYVLSLRDKDEKEDE